MKLANQTEAVPLFLDQAAIALMQLSINHLQLLETMAEEIEALTAASMRRTVVKEASVGWKGAGRAPGSQD